MAAGGGRLVGRGVLVVGVISDTHGLLRPEALAALGGADVILHAGDIGDPAILEALAAGAPVEAVRGNNDRGPWAAALPDRLTVEVGGCRLHLLHDVHDLDVNPVRAGLAAVVTGHSHRPRCERVGGVLFFNPGSAGPRRFHLPITVGRLLVEAGRVEGEIVPLA